MPLPTRPFFKFPAERKALPLSAMLTTLIRHFQNNQWQFNLSYTLHDLSSDNKRATSIPPGFQSALLKNIPFTPAFINQMGQAINKPSRNL